MPAELAIARQARHRAPNLLSRAEPPIARRTANRAPNRLSRAEPPSRADPPLRAEPPIARRTAIAPPNRLSRADPPLRAEPPSPADPPSRADPPLRARARHPAPNPHRMLILLSGAEPGPIVPGKLSPSLRGKKYPSQAARARGSGLGAAGTRPVSSVLSAWETFALVMGRAAGHRQPQVRTGLRSNVHAPSIAVGAELASSSAGRTAGSGDLVTGLMDCGPPGSQAFSRNPQSWRRREFSDREFHSLCSEKKRSQVSSEAGTLRSVICYVFEFHAD